MKKTLTSLLAGAIVLGSSFLPFGKTNADDLLRIYNTQTQYNIAENPGQGEPEQKVVYELKEEIISFNEPNQKVEQEITRYNDDDDSQKSVLYIDEEKNHLGLMYINLGPINLSPEQRQKMTLQDVVLEEDSANTHIYLSLPPGVTFKMHQEMADLRPNAKDKNIILRPTEETRIYEFAANLDSIYETLKADKSELKDPTIVTIAREVISEFSPDANNAYEKWLDRGISKVPGAWGLSMQITKEGTKWMLSEVEKERQKDIRERLGNDNQLVKVPFYQPDVLNPIQFAKNNRGIEFRFDTSKLKQDSTGYLVVEQIAFQNRSNTIPKSTQINGITHPIHFEGMGIVQSIKDLEKIAGTWIGHIKETRGTLTINDNGSFTQGTTKRRTYNIDEGTEVDDGLIRVHVTGANDYMLFLVQDKNTVHFLGDDFNRNLEIGGHSRKELMATFPTLLEYGKQVRSGNSDQKVPETFYDHDYELMLRTGTEPREEQTTNTPANVREEQTVTQSTQEKNTIEWGKPQQYLPEKAKDGIRYLEGYWIKKFSFEDLNTAEKNIEYLLQQEDTTLFHVSSDGKAGFYVKGKTIPKFSQITDFQRETNDRYNLFYDILETPNTENNRVRMIIISKDKAIEIGEGDTLYGYKIPDHLVKKYLEN